MNTKKIAQTLKGLKLDDWSLLVVEQRRATLHLTVKGEIETSIDATRKEAHVTIYKRYGKKLGDARFILFSDDKETIIEEVKDALLICATAKKAAWPLPRKERYTRVKTADPAILAAYKEGKAVAVLERLAKRMTLALEREGDVTSPHIELHLTLRRRSIRNSKGIDVKDTETELFAEAIVTAKKGKEENEFHHALTYGRLADFKPSQFMKSTAQQARDVLHATKLGMIHKKGIILSGIALRDFWAPDLTLNSLVFHASAMAKERKLSRQKKGAFLSKTPFTLATNPLINYNPSSRKMDDDGVASKRALLIKDGAWYDLHGSQRYAHYLKVPATGHLGAVEIAGVEEKSLIEAGVIEIVGFSSFVPNSLSGDFSAEIRLGYLHKNGKRLPIKNAMFTGNLYKMLDSMRMTGTLQLARYKGPKMMRFDDGCYLAGF